VRTLLALLAVVALAGPAQAQDTTRARPQSKKRFDVISREEIEGIRNEAVNAYDVVTLLRPRFFKNRMPAQIGEGDWSGGPRAVLDETPYGGVEALKNIELAAIKEIRYLNGPSASMRFGNEFQGGAIIVITR
jgi:hypothetical protein